MVVGVILVDDFGAPTQVLAARRTGPPELAGRWEFPGGKVQPDEDVLDALRREIVEELGLEVELGAELSPPGGAAGWPIGPDAQLRLFFAVANGEPASVDGSHDQFRWLDLDSLSEVDWLSTDRDAVAALTTRLQAGGSAGEST